MSHRTLGAFQIGALLISASYGIGFLFGSGEMAIHHGMAGALYGVATALGMVMLAAFARPLWLGGGPIWSIFGRLYGPRVERAVAVLSLVWMAGVLAAQIHGGLAIAQQLGASITGAFVIVLLLIFGASIVNLGVAATLFGVCLMASAAALVFALVSFDGLPVYFNALPSFALDLTTFPTGELAAVAIGVTLLVCTGADYQQFVIAARSSRSAILGCLIAAAGLSAIAFLPPAVVVALIQGDGVGGLGQANQIIPMALQKAAGQIGAGAGLAMLLALSAAALGSGAAIVRAMSEALQSGVARRWRHSSTQAAAVSLLIAAALASRGQGIVQTMVSVNIVYLASIGLVLLALVVRHPLPSNLARASMLAGFVTASGLYLARWSGHASGGDLETFLWGLLASIAAALLGRVTGRRAATAE